MLEFSRFTEPVFMPTTKQSGSHRDINISTAQAAEIIGDECAAMMKELALECFAVGSEVAKSHGMILVSKHAHWGNTPCAGNLWDANSKLKADARFDFAVDTHTRELFIVDEVLTYVFSL